MPTAGRRASPAASPGPSFVPLQQPRAALIAGRRPAGGDDERRLVERDGRRPPKRFAFLFSACSRGRIGAREGDGHSNRHELDLGAGVVVPVTLLVRSVEGAPQTLRKGSDPFRRLCYGELESLTCVTEVERLSHLASLGPELAAGAVDEAGHDAAD